VKQLPGAPFYSRLPASPSNIRLGWIGLPGTSALAYYKKIENIAESQTLKLSVKKSNTPA
jgi:hypothetical protein